jgi:ribosomal-protein-alanine N-acetyltransferase
MNLNFTPFPTLHTERLQLRQLTAADAQQMFTIRSHPKVYEFLPDFKPESLSQIEQLLERLHQALLKNQSIMWAICFKENPALIGGACLWNISHKHNKAEIGYDLHPDFHRKGLMQEAVTAVLKYGFEIINLATIEAMTHQKNVASVLLLLKNGFQKVIAEENVRTNWPSNNQLYHLSKQQYLLPKNG